MKLKDLIDEIEMFDEDEMTLFIAALAQSVNHFDKEEFDRVYEEKQRLKQLVKTMSEIPTTDIPDFCLTEKNREGFEVRNG